MTERIQYFLNTSFQIKNFIHRQKKKQRGMNEELLKLKKILTDGQKLSMQGSLDRRMPSKKSMPYFIEARKALRQYVKDYPDDAEGWNIYSLAEECLLNYDMAVKALEKTIKMKGKAEKKDLKRLVLIREYQAEWSEVQLSPKEPKDLGNYLDKKLADPCDHSMRFTKAWFHMKGRKNSAKTIKAFYNRGGSCDCEVLSFIDG